MKLLAAAVSNTGVATVVTAVIGPVVGLLYGTPSAAATTWWPIIGLIWLLVGIALHVGAQMILGRLQE
jgi:hypothetical protein